jgi:peptidoglycan/LPS O-acetylase OafA/YrhL
MSATITPVRTTVRATDTAISDAPATGHSSVRSIWKATGVSGAIAAVATTIVALAARASGIALDVDGEQIPLLGFAQLTLAGAVVGGVIATVLHKRARHPRRTFVVTTVVLTALSVVPDVAIDSGVASKLVLAFTHVVAAAIIVPAVAARTAR